MLLSSPSLQFSSNLSFDNGTVAPGPVGLFMKKLFATLTTILIASALFAVVAPSGPQFSLNAQVDGILFHGFTTERYSSSDDILAAQNDIEKEAFVKGLDLTSDAAQDIGYYSFYSTTASLMVIIRSL